jgi:hypothetical protein
VAHIRPSLANVGCNEAWCPGVPPVRPLLAERVVDLALAAALLTRTANSHDSHEISAMKPTAAMEASTTGEAASTKPTKTTTSSSGHLRSRMKASRRTWPMVDAM